MQIKRSAGISLLILAASYGLHAQAFSPSLSMVPGGQMQPHSLFLANLPFAGPEGGAAGEGSHITPASTVKPFSTFTVGVGMSSAGVDLSVATRLNPYLDLRGNGDLFNFSVNNINTNGFTVSAKLALDSARLALDVYPLKKNFRVSPGVVFYNTNGATATFVAASGTSFSLNNVTFYSSSGANAVQGLGTFNMGNASASLTTGFANIMPFLGKRWAFPFEIGAAFTGAPKVNLTLTGQVCDVNGQNCQNVATNSTAQSALAAQVVTYQNDINPLTVYPILSFGITYTVSLRK